MRVPAKSFRRCTMESEGNVSESRGQEQSVSVFPAPFCAIRCDDISKCQEGDRRVPGSRRIEAGKPKRAV